MPRSPTPDLLVDERNEIIPSDRIVYLPHAECEPLQLPQWVNLTILSALLFSALREQSGGTTGRGLVARLSPFFQLREYSLIPLITEINTAATHQVEMHPVKEREYRLEALQAIYYLYNTGGISDRAQLAPNYGVRVYIPSRTGAMFPATSLYFGQDYPGGLLTEALYGGIDPNAVVASPGNLGLDADPNKLAEFLSWLGVATQPRVHTDDALGYWYNDFAKYAKTQIRYPAHFEDIHINKADDIPYRARVAAVTDVDRLNALIERADPHALLAWIALDTRIEKWSHGEPVAELRAHFPRKQNYRKLTSQPVPSYVLWRLANSRWLPTTAGDRRSPNQCIMPSQLSGPSQLSDDLDTLLPRPALLHHHDILRKLNVDKRQMRAALERVGVRPNLNDLSWDDVYALMLDLPHRDLTGAAARTLYRAVAARPDDKELPSSDNRDRFLREGKLWGKRGENEGYYAIKDLRYIDTAIVPDLIRREIPLFALDRRRRAQKVERLFGVGVLDDHVIIWHIDTHDESSHTAEFQKEIDRLKPFILAMRLNDSADVGRIGRLRSLMIKPCRLARGYARIGDKDRPVDLHNTGDSIVDGDVAYLTVELPEDQRLLGDPLVTSAVGDIFAETMQVDRASDYDRLASCRPNQRPSLLARILGIDREEIGRLLEQARTKLDLPQVDMDDTRDETSTDDTKADALADGKSNDPPTYAPPPPNPAASRDEAAATPNPGHPPNTASKAGPINAVTTRTEVHQPRQAGPSVSFRVRRMPTNTSGVRAARRVTDGTRCEELACRFEEEQNRYPLLVAHLQGTNAPGCDVLSFASNEDRHRFKQTHDWVLVRRFIEVKGRSSVYGSVELGGNELKAAQRWRERYHLYRVYESDPGEFEVMILGDPVTADSDVVHKIDLSRQMATERWSVSAQQDGATAFGNERGVQVDDVDIEPGPTAAR